MRLSAGALRRGGARYARAGRDPRGDDRLLADRRRSVQQHAGAGDLQLSGGAEKLLEAEFNYNVEALKPELKYSNGTLVLQQPDVNGLPGLKDLTDFRNEWKLRLNKDVPMELSVDVGGGTSTLQLAGLSLTKLDISLGAGLYTVDLTGDWPKNLDVSIDAGAAAVTVRLPSGVGAQVKVGSGPHTIEAYGLNKAGDVYTNAAYGVSAVTMQVDLQVGIGTISLEVEDVAMTPDHSAGMSSHQQTATSALERISPTWFTYGLTTKETVAF